MKYKRFRFLHMINDKVIAPAFERADLPLVATDVRECGKYIKSIKCQNCGAKHFTGAFHCKSKYCAICNKAKSMLWLARTFIFAKHWLDSGNYVVLANYTLRDREYLQDGLSTISGAWRYFTNTNRISRKEFKSRFVGGLRTLEVKIGKNSGIWHPHYHTLVFKRKKTSDDKTILLPLWQQAVEAVGGGKFGTENQEGYIYIKSFGAYINGEHKKDLSYEQQLMAAIMEQTKYITKFDYASLNSARLREAYNALKGTRQISTWGVFRKIQLQVEHDIKEMDHDKITDFVCQVCGCTEGQLEKLYKDVYLDHPIFDYERTPLSEVNEERVKQFKRIYNIVEEISEKEENEQLQFLEGSNKSMGNYSQNHNFA